MKKCIVNYTESNVEKSISMEFDSSIEDAIKLFYEMVTLYTHNGKGNAYGKYKKLAENIKIVSVQINEVSPFSDVYDTTLYEVDDEPLKSIVKKYTKNK